MGSDLTTRTEWVLTRLGMWRVLQGSSALVAAVIGSVALLEVFTPALARLLVAVPLTVLHVFAVGNGVLLGVIGFFTGDLWDRVLFEGFYGPRGRWLDTVESPLFIFPAGAALKGHQTQAAHALPRKADKGEGIYLEAVKVARRQAERWERIQHPLILSQFLRGFLWPCLLVAFSALCAAGVLPLLGLAAQASWFLVAGGGCLVLMLLLLIPYSHLRVEHMVRLYQDVGVHLGRRKPERR